jgi:hypothetical protein
MKAVYVENIVKNLILIGVLVGLYPVVDDSFEELSDTGQAGNLLVAVSILIVTACFGNFAFTYEKVGMVGLFPRFWAHITTALLMLLIGISVEICSVLCEKILGKIAVLDIAWLLLYASSVMYDFWDVQRTELRKSCGFDELGEGMERSTGLCCVDRRANTLRCGLPARKALRIEAISEPNVFVGALERLEGVSDMPEWDPGALD